LRVLRTPFYLTRSQLNSGVSQRSGIAMIRVMFRTAIRNVGLAVGLALPVLLLTAGFIAWLGPSSLSFVHGEIGFSMSGALSGALFWYIILVFPTLGFAVTHQLFLAIPAPRWSKRRTRAFSLGTSIGVALIIAGRIIVTSTDVRAAGLILTVVVPAAFYGVFARPLRRGVESSTPLANER
jgi:hypothetical protein